MKPIALSLMFAAVAGSALAQAQSLPTTPDESYALGQRFAQCSARVSFIGSVATQQGLNETAKLSEGVARGWKLAGMFLIVDGLSLKRQAEVEPIFDTLVENKLDQLNALYELDPAAMGLSLPLEFEEECQPWASTQQALIEAMRRGSE